MTIEYGEDRVLITTTAHDLRTADGLARAVDGLLEVTRDLRSLLQVDAIGNTKIFTLVSRWATPEGLVDERELFARCVRHDELHDRMTRYVRQLIEGQVGINFFIGEGLWHHDQFPAGSFAVVPLAFHAPSYVPLLVEHMRSLDLSHESFHTMLIDRLLATHGICQETFDLLVFRAADGSDGGGTSGMDNLRGAVHWHRLREEWAPFGGADGFRERLHATSESLPDDLDDNDFVASHLEEIGTSLLGDRPDELEPWRVACENAWNVHIHRTLHRYKPQPAATEAQWLAEWGQPLGD